MANPNKNWNCDNDKCTHPSGETRLYPLGGGGNLILCHACWDYENRYRRQRGKESGQPENWPLKNWNSAEPYGCGPWTLEEERAKRAAKE